MRTLLRRLAAWLKPSNPLPAAPAPQPPDPRLAIAAGELAEARAREVNQRSGLVEFISEMIEAKRMAGAGPWKQDAATIRESNRLLKLAESVAFDGPRSAEVVALTEAQLPGAIGAFGDIELALQNVDWRREINFSWLEFSRWGIQQIMLISRLYYVKNPICRRLVDVCAAYVFARGVEVSTEDEDANDVIEDFFRRNRQVFGHVGMIRQERAKDLDGNIFWAFFSDTAASGKTTIRTIDPIEIQDIVTDPEDDDTELYYHRIWTEDALGADGVITHSTRECWYPALNRELLQDRPLASIGGKPVAWDTPLYHRKCGQVGKWRFGCPRIYPLLDWAKETRRYLEACASVAQSLAQVALVATTKGGAQALEGLKQQFQTTVGPSAQIWDTNPPAVRGSFFGSGIGTELSAFKTQGAGLDPEKVRQYKLMCCMVKGVPETFLGDVQTGNLATATSLDRPTETIMMELQEEWVEDLTVMIERVLDVSNRATSGKLRESFSRIGVDPDAVQILQAERVYEANGRWHWVTTKLPADPIELREAKAKAKKSAEVKIRVTFPNIREGDVPALVGAVVESMTLANKGGQVTGIDEKAGVRKLYELIGIENGDELAEAQYPEKEYDPNRTTEPEPAPIPKLEPRPGGTPQNPGGLQTAPPAQQLPAPDAPAPKEALRRAARRLLRAIHLLEAAGDGMD